MRNVNYISMVDGENDSFLNNGWADGYADIPSQHNEILGQLYGQISEDILIECLDLYLRGYEVGNFMSEMSEQIYDEDGNLKEDEYDLSSFSYYEEAKRLFLSKKMES